jgi:hypothetical protein
MDPKNDDKTAQADQDMLVRNEGVQSPALWFFLLAIPIVISVYFAFVRPDPAQVAAQARIEQEQKIQLERENAAKTEDSAQEPADDSAGAPVNTQGFARPAR